jgi:hypothetical protein
MVTRSLNPPILTLMLTTFPAPPSLAWREKSDLKVGFLRRSDRHLPIPDVHIIKPDMQVWKESDSQSAANVDFHPQGFGGGPFQPGFGATGANKKNRTTEMRMSSPMSPTMAKRMFSMILTPTLLFLQSALCLISNPQYCLLGGPD